MFVKTLRHWFRKSKPGCRARPHQYRRLCFEHLEELAMLTNFTVSSTGDIATDSTTLRYALTNLSAGSNTITFMIPGSGAHVIQPQSPLPNITEPVTIDGTQQTGYAGSPLIRIDGSMAGTSGVTGLTVYASNCTIEGVDITDFSGDGLYITGGSNIIENDYIGIDPTGTTAEGNQYEGLEIFSASNQIVQNVISGNGYNTGTDTANGSAAVYIASAGSNGNVITGNYIGTNSAGTAAVANGGAGIFIAGGAQNTRIGTNGNDVNYAAERNVISGNLYQGIYIEGTTFGTNTTGTIVAGNYIGTNETGTGALANGSGGIFVGYGARDHAHRNQHFRFQRRRRAKHHFGERRCGSRNRRTVFRIQLHGQRRRGQLHRYQRRRNGRAGQCRRWGLHLRRGTDQPHRRQHCRHECNLGRERDFRKCLPGRADIGDFLRPQHYR